MTISKMLFGTNDKNIVLQKSKFMLPAFFYSFLLTNAINNGIINNIVIDNTIIDQKVRIWQLRIIHLMKK